ncbi:MAG: hypothetical protein WCG80_07710 [Spirochaetales bacterium]
MAKSFVLSGHFTSPAEVDPWTGLRHDYSSRENFQQRFQQLSRTCYGANSASRILGPDGKIRKIVNNYASMAFSFSPSLLDELSSRSPNVYRRVVAADAESLAALGHGNALAQVWSASVLPLLTPPQVHRQLKWGIAAFEKHFHRRPEGFWLPHQGFSESVADHLIALGVPWVVLSPWQAEAHMPADDGSWQSLGEAPAPADRVYRLDRPEGSLGIFFDDAALLQGIHNNHLLRDASRFAHAIRERVIDRPFSTLSADGSLFGQEEPFADMCLAALWDKLGVGDKVEVVNYGVLWERHPPTWQIRLKKGANEEGTSRDCPHGVQRWKADCGCSSVEEQFSAAASGSSWHQRWRAPLFQTMTRLQERLFAAEAQVLASMDVRPEEWEATLPSLLLRQCPPAEWVAHLVPDASEVVASRLLRWAWASHHATVMMQAALWHEADPLFPTARGGLLEALRALELAGPELETPLFQEFLAGLSIEGNQGGTLRLQLERDLLKRRHGVEFPAALVLFDRLLRPRSWYQEQLGTYQVTQFTKDRQELADGVRYSGRLDLLHTDLDQVHKLDYLLLENEATGVTLTLKPVGSTAKPLPFDLEWLPMGERGEIVLWLGTDLEATLASETQVFFPLLRKSLVYSRLLAVPPLPMTKSLMELAVTRKILELADSAEVPQEEALAELEAELAFAKDYGLVLDRERLNARFSRWLFQALSRPDDFTRESVVKAVETLLSKLFAWNFQPDITVAQSLVFEALQARGPALLLALEQGQVEALGELKRLLRLGGLLLIDTTELRNRLLD